MADEVKQGISREQIESYIKALQAQKILKNYENELNSILSNNINDLFYNEFKIGKDVALSFNSIIQKLDRQIKACISELQALNIK